MVAGGPADWGHGFHVYSLSDPRSPRDVRYVGLTRGSRKRWLMHVALARNGHRRGTAAPLHRWVLGLLEAGLRPSMARLETVPGLDAGRFECARDREAAWVRRLTAEGHELFNVHEHVRSLTPAGAPRKRAIRSVVANRTTGQ